ncbi:MAG: nucleoside phosphorylase, partial [Nanoarchaeota archaeon]
TIYQHKNIGIVLMTGIGSPNAATVMEELIALGGKEFLNIGSAGGLKDFGIFLCEKSIRDEGTSYHYITLGKYAYPDKGLTNRLEKQLVKNRISFQKATSWTIDAPYRETKAEIQKYKKQGVATVEMESSALFTVAQVRKVKIASAFVVSDILGDDKWDPQFDAKHVNQNLNKLFDVALECLLKR